MYTVSRLGMFDVVGLLNATGILYRCGKDMAEKYGLHHWNNPYLKTLAIACLGRLKNTVYLVKDGKTPIATFGISEKDGTLLFSKFAVSPEYSGKGVGGFCLAEIERIAKEQGCKEVSCEVYDKSEHAKAFYEHKGYSVYGASETRKYKQYKLKKIL